MCVFTNLYAILLHISTDSLNVRIIWKQYWILRTKLTIDVELQESTRKQSLLREFFKLAQWLDPGPSNGRSQQHLILYSLRLTKKNTIL
jgi:hypothetical protein